MKYEEKFIVVNKKYLSTLSPEKQNQFINLLLEMNCPNHNYLVVNHDETYANAVWEIICLGETLKEMKLKDEVER